MSGQREFYDPVLSVASIGPFHRWPVTVNGWTVPHLEAQETDEGVWVHIDRRFSLLLNNETTPGQILFFMADLAAVSKGFACHPRMDGWDREGPHVPPAPTKWPWDHMVGVGRDVEVDGLGDES